MEDCNYVYITCIFVWWYMNNLIKMHRVNNFKIRSHVFTVRKEISVYNVNKCHSLEGLTCSSWSVRVSVFPVQKLCLADSKTNFVCPGNYSAPHQNMWRLATRYSYSSHCGDRYWHSLLLQMVAERVTLEMWQHLCVEVWKWRRRKCVKSKHHILLPTICLRYTMSENQKTEAKMSDTGRMYKRVNCFYNTVFIYPRIRRS